MSYPTSITLSGIKLELRSERGVVVSQDKFSETHIRSRVNHEPGQRVEIESDVVCNHHFWIRKEDAKEMEFRFADFSPSVRNGHDVEVVLARGGASEGNWYPVSVMNHSTGNEYSLPAKFICERFGLGQPKWLMSNPKSNSAANRIQMLLVFLIFPPIVLIWMTLSGSNIDALTAVFTWFMSWILGLCIYGVFVSIPSNMAAHKAIRSEFSSPYNALNAVRTE